MLLLALAYAFPLLLLLTLVLPNLHTIKLFKGTVRPVKLMPSSPIALIRSSVARWNGDHRLSQAVTELDMLLACSCGILSCIVNSDIPDMAEMT